MDSSRINEGHHIFRNQPSYKIFNSSLERTDDTLYALLNDVDPVILSEEQTQLSNIFATYSYEFSRSDPRNQQTVTTPVYDYTSGRLAYDFPNPKNRSSMLSRDQHAACIRVLLAWQRNSVVNEEDFIIWHSTNRKRSDEQQTVQKHIFGYAKAHKDRLFAPMKTLVIQYNKWFQLRMEQLRRKFLTNLNSSYSTFSGLPQLAQCKSLNSQSACIEDVQLLCHAGHVRVWPTIELRQNELSTLRVRLERFLCAEETETDIIKQCITTKLEEQLEQADEDIFVLPVESLLMLFLPGAYIDLPTEMQLEIREISGSEFKCIEFHQPMPARYCGWHTNSLIVTQAYAAYAPAQWLALSPSVTANKESASKQKSLRPAKFKLSPIDDQPQTVKEQKSNCALVSWRMLENESEQCLQIYSSLSIPAVSDTTIKKPLGHHFFKLESKPECGCEILTKYELLRSWLQLKLLQAEVAHCTRISLQDFTLLLEEHLTVGALEQQLNEYYHISMPQQLSQLLEFLKMLRSIPPGEYLLRYTSKYKDKFLLCCPTKEPTPQSFKLMELLAGGAPPNEINFLTQSDSYLPISPLLCSRFHEQHQLLPCCFPVIEKSLLQSSKSKKKPKPEKKPVQKWVPRTRISTGKNPISKTGQNGKKKQRRNRQRAKKKAEPKEAEIKDL